MAEEEIKGPQELTEKIMSDDSDLNSSDSELDNENEEGDDYHMEKLRQYQLNRLKYYYAVIECNSVSAADKLYAECDGIEYESTATKLDLRFIPDDMTFDDEPKEVCTEAPDASKYKPRLFTTTALQQAKVELTWDENDVDRAELNEKVNSGKLNEIPDAELRKFVAYSSEEEDEEEENQFDSKLESDFDDENSDNDKSKKSSKNENVISKYKNLLNEINKKEEEKKKNRIEMEFSWGIENNSSKTEKLQNKAKEATELTPFEKLIEKKKDKKRARKEKIRELKKMHGQSDNSESDDDLPDGVDLNDPYFAEEFANGKFAPAKTKKSKSQEKQTNDSAKESDDNDQKQKDLELLLDDDDDKAHFSLKKIQERENESKTSKKRRKKLKNNKDAESKKEIQDNFEVDVGDSRFSAIYSSHLFNIDPTDSHYKKTKAMDAIVQEKLKRKIDDDKFPDSGSGEPSEKKHKDVATNILIKSIKRKVQQKK